MKNIVAQCNDYDEREFEKLVNEHQGMITSIIKNLELECGHFKVSRQDLNQEGLIALYEAYKSYDKKSGVKFSTFAYMVIKRKLNKYYRSCIYRYQMEAISIDTYELFDHHPLSCGHQVNDSKIDLACESSSKRVDYLFRQLREEDQNIVALRCLNNTYDEIADKLNITKKKVDSRLSRIRLRFKDTEYLPLEPTL